MTAEAPATPGLVSLAEIIAQAPDGQVPAPGIEVWCDGQRWELVGAGERAATLAPPGGGWEGRVRRRQELVHVDPDAVRWTPAEPSPKEAFARLQNLDRETKAARAAYRADADAANAVQRAAGNRERSEPGHRAESLVSDRICSRDGCSTPLHIRNTSGECVACQRKCPTCGGPKSAIAANCQRCSAHGGRPPVATAARQPLSAPPSRAEMPLADVVPLKQPNPAKTSATVASDEGSGGGRSADGAGGIVALGARRAGGAAGLRRRPAGPDRATERPGPRAGARGRAAPRARGRVA